MAADSDDLFDALDEIAKKYNVIPGKNVKTIMNTWVNQRGYPVVTVTRDYKTGTADVRQSRFIISNSEEWTEKTTYISKLWVPISYTTQESPDFVDTRANEWLEPLKNLTIHGSFNPDQWLIINKQLTGLFIQHIVPPEE